MADLFDNPMGLDGFEFVEFASPTPGVLEACLRDAGLHARWRSTARRTWRCIARATSTSSSTTSPPASASYFAAEHGPSACGMAFRVRDSHKAYERALALGAQPVDLPPGPMELKLPAIKGIGGMPLYLIDRYGDGTSIYDIDFKFIEGVDRHPKGHGLQDHRPPHAQRLPRPHGVLGGLLRADLQLPRDPLLRHQGRVHGTHVEGDDRARRQDPHSAQRGGIEVHRARSRSS